MRNALSTLLSLTDTADGHSIASPPHHQHLCSHTQPSNYPVRRTEQPPNCIPFYLISQAGGARLIDVWLDLGRHLSLSTNARDARVQLMWPRSRTVSPLLSPSARATGRWVLPTNYRNEAMAMAPWHTGESVAGYRLWFAVGERRMSDLDYNPLQNGGPVWWKARWPSFCLCVAWTKLHPTERRRSCVPTLFRPPMELEPG